MSDPTLIADLVRAGLAPDLVQRVAVELAAGAADLAAAKSAAQAEKDALERRRASDRERQAKRRHVTSQDKRDPLPPAPPTPTRSLAGNAHARETPAPETHGISPKIREAAKQNGILGDRAITAEIAHCLAHYGGRGTKFENWEGILCSWFYKPFRQQQPAVPAQTGPPAVVQRINGFRIVSTENGYAQAPKPSVTDVLRSRIAARESG